MPRKRPPLSFPELEHRGRQAILRSAEEVQAEQVLLEQGEAEIELTSDGPQDHKPTSGQVVKPTSRDVGKPARPLVEKYTTHLRPETIKAIKRLAFETERKDYQVVQEALDAYLKRRR